MSLDLEERRKELEASLRRFAALRDRLDRLIEKVKNALAALEE